MSAGKSPAQLRLTQIKDILTFSKTATTIPFDPDSTKFPTRHELPQIAGAPPGAAWVWGEDDYVSMMTSVLNDCPLMSTLVGSFESPYSDPSQGRRCRGEDWRDGVVEVRRPYKA